MAESLVAPLLRLIPYVLGRLEKELLLPSRAKTELEYLKDLIGAIKEFLEEANSRQTIDEKLKVSMKRARKFIYDSQDAIDDFMRRENCQLEGLFSCFYEHYSHRTFVSEAEQIRKMVDNYISTRETTAAMKTRGQSSADHAQSSSTSHQSLSVAFSGEKDDMLVGIEGPKNQLVQWLTEKNLMSKVIFVHGEQGVGKSSLVGAVLRDKRVKKRFKYYVWIDGELENVENVEMWNLTKNNQREQVKLEQALQRMEEDEDLRNNKYRWALILDDVGKARVIDSLQVRLAPTRPNVLITTRISSLESYAKRLTFTSRASVDSLGAQSGGSPPEPPKSLYGFPYFKHVFLFFSSLACRPIKHVFLFFSSLACRPRAFLDSPGAQFGGKPPKCYGFHNFKHVALSTVNSLDLFRREMFSNRSCPDALTKVTDSILKKCEGLPLAIRATCQLLDTKSDGVSGNSQIVDWEQWNGRLGEELLSNGDNNPLIRRMITLRMDYLRNGCLFYLSIFPLGCPIRCSTLMRLWMAERFAMQDGTTTSQEIAEKNLKELVDHNLVQKVEKTSYGRVRTCRVHNLLHEIIIKKSKDDEFAMIVADQKDEWPETIWRLSFSSQMDPIKDGTIYHSEMGGIKDGVRVKRLRSLLVFNEVNPKSMEELLRQVDRLNVLHLEVSSLKSFPKGIPRLKHLRYLNLRGAKIETIPDGIRNLIFLETLDLKGTCVRELPGAILALKALRHLLVYRYDGSPAADTTPKHGVKVSLQLGVLKSLQKLCLIKLDEANPSKLAKLVHWNGRGLSLLEELGKLKELQRLGISELRSTDMSSLCSSIEKLKDLKSLHLIAASGEILDLSSVCNAPRSLQRVHLIGRLGTLPKWLLSLDSLTKLVLKARQLNGYQLCQQNGDLLQHLRELPYLKHLELEQAFDASEMTFEARKFQQLCFLGLDRFEKLASIRVEDGALPTLERLSLARCKLLTTVPQVITLPKKLKCLEYHGMSDDFEMAINGNEEVRARLKVQSKVWIDGHVVPAVKYQTDNPGSLPLAPICKK